MFMNWTRVHQTVSEDYGPGSIPLSELLRPPLPVRGEGEGMEREMTDRRFLDYLYIKETK